jgi:phosphatidylglycerol---prolipoprotein diacylglyceryl transferase
MVEARFFELADRMTFPVYISFFGFRIHPHFLFESLAYTVGFLVYRKLKDWYGDPIQEGVRWSVIAAAAVGSVLGSKILCWLEDPARVLHHWQDPAVLLGGKTIVGGLIGGLIAVEWVKKRVGKTRRTGDLFAVPMCVGIALGRIGCFLSGLQDDTYGLPTTLPWGINFGDGHFRHPTQLYEIVFVLILAAILYRLMNRPHLQGDIFKLFMVSYFGWRLVIDFIKPDPRFMSMTSLQWASIAMILFYCGDVFRWIAAALPARISSNPETNFPLETVAIKQDVREGM